MYENAIIYWQEQIDLLKKQASFLEVAEIYLKIADINRDNFKNEKKERENIQYAIHFLKHKADVLLEFNELEKLARIYQNIANLYSRISNLKKAIEFNKMAIKLARDHGFYQILSFTYQQLFICFSDLKDYNSAKEVLLIAIEYFANECLKYENEDIINLNLSELYQIIKKLYNLLNDSDNYTSYAKKEASSYISIAQSLGDDKKDAERKGTLYRGAALCYREIQNNLIECSSCFFLAGNYFLSVEKFDDAGENYNNSAQIFEEIGNFQKAYELYIKAGKNYQDAKNLQPSIENFLNGHNLAIEKELSFDKKELYNALIQELNQFAKEKIRSKQFYIAATSILESIKLYANTENFNSILVAEMIKRVSKTYYKAANFKKIRKRNIRYAYFLSAMSSLLLNRIDKAKEIMAEIHSDGKAIEKSKAIVEFIIDRLEKKQEISIEIFPENLQNFINRYEEIKYIIELFNII